MDNQPVGPIRKQDFYIWIDFFLFRKTMVLIKRTCTVQAKVKSTLDMSKNSKTWWTKYVHYAVADS